MASVTAMSSRGQRLGREEQQRMDLGDRPAHAPAAAHFAQWRTQRWMVGVSFVSVKSVISGMSENYGKTVTTVDAVSTYGAEA